MRDLFRIKWLISNSLRCSAQKVTFFKVPSYFETINLIRIKDLIRIKLSPTFFTKSSEMVVLLNPSFALLYSYSLFCPCPSFCAQLSSRNFFSRNYEEVPGIASHRLLNYVLCFVPEIWQHRRIVSYKNRQKIGDPLNVSGARPMVFKIVPYYSPCPLKYLMKFLVG
jgi:hypothetical protein